MRLGGLRLSSGGLESLWVDGLSRLVERLACFVGRWNW